MPYRKYTLTLLQKDKMAASNMGSFITGLLVVAVVVGLVYMVDPTFFGLMGPSVEGFAPAVCPMNMTPEEAAACVKSKGKFEKSRGKLAGPRRPRCPMNMSVDQADACVKSGGTKTGNRDRKKAGFEDMNQEDMQENQMENEKEEAEAFENMASVENSSTSEGPADFGTASAPAGCYPRDQLTPSELLPKDNNSVWAEQNPMGPGSLKGKNFLSAGALLGVNTVGQSLRNANLQLRSEPPNPQMPVSIFNQSTIQPDVNRRPLEIN